MLLCLMQCTLPNMFSREEKLILTAPLLQFGNYLFARKTFSPTHIYVCAELAALHDPSPQQGSLIPFCITYKDRFSFTERSFNYLLPWL